MKNAISFLFLSYILCQYDDTECFWLKTLLMKNPNLNSLFSISIGHQKLYPGRPLKTARPEKIRKTPETSIKYPSRCQVSVLHLPCIFHCFWLYIPLRQLIYFARKDFQRWFFFSFFFKTISVDDKFRHILIVQQLYKAKNPIYFK